MSEKERIALKELLVEQYKESLFKFAKYGLGYAHMTKRTHGPICDALSRPSPRKLIVVPRGCFKSSICSIAYPIWLLLNNPNLRIFLDSELYGNSKNLLREIKGHMQSRNFRDMFGNLRSNVWNEGEIIVATRKIIKKEASITCGGIGTEKTGQHYDVAIIDDINSPKNSHTVEGCKKVIDHYKHLQAIMEHPTSSPIVVVGTRYSQNDLIGYILDNEIFDDTDSDLIHQNHKAPPVQKIFD